MCVEINVVWVEIHSLYMTENDYDFTLLKHRLDIYLTCTVLTHKVVISSKTELEIFYR